MDTFERTYDGRDWVHQTLITHAGELVAMAVDAEGVFHYAVLDADEASKGADNTAWPPEPDTLAFPGELVQVGFGALTPDRLKDVRQSAHTEHEPGTLATDERDPHLSTTARLTAPGPFKLISDGGHLYLFRQSVGATHGNALSRAADGSLTGDTAGTPFAVDTVLVDRFQLSGRTLIPVKEVRFRRSRSASRPASRTDALGARDMDGNWFLEPTRCLTLLPRVRKGQFAVVLLPTDRPDVQRWQLFSVNAETLCLEQWNVARSADGWFDTRGEETWTSPDSDYAKAVLERRPGKCPFTGKPLVPKSLRRDRGQTAVQLRGDARLELPGIPFVRTLELWIKLAELPTATASLISMRSGGVSTPILSVDGGQWIAHSGSGRAKSKHAAVAGAWVHLALVWSSDALVGYCDARETLKLAGRMVPSGTMVLGSNAAQVTIDELRLWTRERTAAGIREDRPMRLRGDEPGLVTYLRFDEGAGECSYDLTTTGRSGMMTRGARWVGDAAPVGNRPGVDRNVTTVFPRAIAGGMEALVYTQQEMRRSGHGKTERPSAQNMRVMLACQTAGPPIESNDQCPVTDGLVLFLDGTSYEGGKRWRDRSSSGHNAKLAPGAEWPAAHLVDNHRGASFAAVRFSVKDGLHVDDRLRINRGAPHTVMVIDRFWSDRQGRGLQGRDANWLLGRYVGAEGYFAGDWVGRVSTQTGRFRLSCATFDPNSEESVWRRDGSELGRARLAAGPGRLAFGLGGSHHEPADFDVAALLVWNRALDTPERQSVERWLGALYGLRRARISPPPVESGLVLNLQAAGLEAGRWLDGTEHDHHAAPRGEAPVVKHLTTSDGKRSVAVARFEVGSGVVISERLDLSEAGTIVIVDRLRRGAGRTLQVRDRNWLLGHWSGQRGAWSSAGSATAFVGDSTQLGIEAVVYGTGSPPRIRVDRIDLERPSAFDPPGVLGINQGGGFSHESSACDVAAIFAWNRALTDDELLQVEVWIAGVFPLGVALEDAPDPRHLAMLDVAVARDGSITRLPARLGLPTMRGTPRTTHPNLDVLQATAKAARAAAATARASLEEATHWGTMMSAVEGPLTPISTVRVLLDFLSRLRDSSNPLGKRLMTANRNVEYEDFERDCDPIHSLIVGARQRFGDQTPDPLGIRIELDRAAKEVPRFKAQMRTIPNVASTLSSFGVLRFNLRLMRSKAQLLEGFWQSRSDGLAGRPDEKLTQWLARERATRAATSQTAEATFRRAEDAVRVAKAALTPSRSTDREGPEPVAMPMVHLDSRGLTASGGLLGFASSPSQPMLARSALGRVSLSYRGEGDSGGQDQLFVLPYDTHTARRILRLETDKGQLGLIARSDERALDDTSITISNARSGDADRCDVRIENDQLGLWEVWPDVPRDAGHFATVIGGGRGVVRVPVGRVARAHTAERVASLDLKRAATRAVPEGDIVMVGSVRVQVSKDVAIGHETVEFEAIDEMTVAENTLVVHLRPYRTARVTSNAAGAVFKDGSRLLRPHAIGRGRVRNGTAKETAPTPSTRWLPDAPGSALLFEGVEGLVGDSTDSDWAISGHATIEAWIRPDAECSKSSLIHVEVGGGLAQLGLLEEAGKLYAAARIGERSGRTNVALSPDHWTHVAAAYRHDHGLQFDGDAKLDAGDGDALDILESLTLEIGLVWTGAGGILSKGTRKHADGIGIPYALDVDGEGKVTFRYEADGDVVALTAEKALERSTFHWLSVVRRVVREKVETKEKRDIGGETKEVVTDVEVAESVELAIFIDGKQAGTKKTQKALPFGGAGPLIIGSSPWSDSALSGTISTLRLWSSERETNKLGKRILASQDGLIAWWKFDEGKGRIAADCRTGNDARIKGASWVDTPDPKGARLRFLINGRPDAGETLADGALRRRERTVALGAIPGSAALADHSAHALSFTPLGGAAQCPGALSGPALARREALSLSGTRAIELGDPEHLRLAGDLTIELWVRPTQLPAADAHGVGLIDKNYAGEGSLFMRGDGLLFLCGNEGEPGSGAANYQNLTVTGAFSAGQWTHIAVVRDTAAKELRGYVDGELKGTQAITMDTRASTSSWKVGTYYHGTHFTGDLDDIRFWSTARAASTIKRDYTRTLTGREEGLALYLHRGRLHDPYRGRLEEVRIWKTTRTDEQIQDNMYGRLRGERALLRAGFSFDRWQHVGGVATRWDDEGLHGLHLTPSPGPERIFSDAPVAIEAPMLRSALAGISTRLHRTGTSAVAAAEYGDLQHGDDGSVSGVLKQAHSWLDGKKWILRTGHKVGALVREWVGQAQMNPQVVGFVEGAPPVPSENLTRGAVVSDLHALNSSKVTYDEVRDVTYTVSSNRSYGFSTAFEAKASLGAGMQLVIAPLGLGFIHSTTMEARLSGRMEGTNTWSEGHVAGQGVHRGRSLTVGVAGGWEEATAEHDKPNALAPRWTPSNVGHAMVQSQTADLYALRLAHTGALVRYSMVPNVDIPMDWNLITFPINPLYTKQGTLDGRIGCTSDGAIQLDEHYPNARGYGEYSYFKPREAYALKRRIEREEQQLRAMYDAFDTKPAGAVGTAIGAGVGLAAALTPVGAMGLGAAATIGGLISALTTDHKLPKEMASRNIANTYVWTADGGFLELSTQRSLSTSESYGGDYQFAGAVEGGFALDVDIGVSLGLEFNSSLGGTFNLTRTRSKDSSESYGLSVTADPPGDLQQYRYANGVAKPVYENGKPVTQFGKVDCYRFMSFYLEPDVHNTEDLFAKVIDPRWLESDSSAAAAALRQARANSKTPASWRIFHRVTFVSRVLPPVPPAGAGSLQKKAVDIGLSSNWEIVRAFGPLIRPGVSDGASLAADIERAVEMEYPELKGHEDEVRAVMAAFLGIDAD